MLEMYFICPINALWFKGLKYLKVKSYFNRLSDVI
jgi:hypothetical protein